MVSTDRTPREFAAASSEGSSRAPWQASSRGSASTLGATGTKNHVDLAKNHVDLAPS